MPRVPDKIIINCSVFDADAYSMYSAFEDGEKLSAEIMEVGGGKAKGNLLLKEDADQHLAEQEAICKDLDMAMANCIKRQRALNDARRKWLDTKL
jgi:hypothetical protein